MTDAHFLVINPNSTASMTEKIAIAARQAGGAASRITAVNPEDGPAAIQGPEDGTAALPGLFKVFDQHIQNDPSIDAVIIACFDDTGLFELKERSPVPVIGIGEAAYHIASVAAPKFSVVTTLSVSVPVLEHNLILNGLAARCAKVRASDVAVLELEDPKSNARHKIENEIATALQEDGIGAVALGCAGMADLADDLSRKFQIPVIDGVASAVRLAQALPLRNR
ncbi:aspartate/glutamate racemase family protein [uncultured Roseibium sp.]|uniref:aspartate/glutamate racemase family protein n=1 Tax=uncultured Roseibium sp. TaxID=1936171 RepID=UPI00260A6A4B|nr:aspartate/glutamate racemase family protein [uncultured Roseibium sp.]